MPASEFTAADAALLTRNGEAIPDATSLLIRTIDGRITFWSRGMASRYGFAPAEAHGQVAHELLRTTFWHPLDEIQKVLVAENSWSGGLLHRCADGWPAMCANHWRLHPAMDGHGPLVSELHEDIVSSGTAASRQLADVMAAVAHQLSEPLTAINNYIGAAQRGLQQGWPDWASQREASARMETQLVRAKEILRLVRDLGEALRSPR